MTNESKRLSRLDFKAHAAQHPLRRRWRAALACDMAQVVCEPHVARTPRSRQAGVPRASSRSSWSAPSRAACVGNAFVEQPEHALGGRHRLLERVELVRQILQRLKEAAHQLQKRGDRPNASASAISTRCAPATIRLASAIGRQHFDRGEVQRVVRDRIQVRLADARGSIPRTARPRSPRVRTTARCACP